MGKVETLSEVKRAEDEVRQAREKASVESARMLRDARAKSGEIISKAEADAEGLYRREVESASAAMVKERDTILKTGRAAADAALQTGSGPRLSQAADVMVKRFLETLRA
ncbi:MAG: hypothetical protein ACYDDF_02430 [Thermoplasmatota archaeon]